MRKNHREAHDCDHTENGTESTIPKKTKKTCRSQGQINCGLATIGLRVCSRARGELALRTGYVQKENQGEASPRFPEVDHNGHKWLMATEELPGRAVCGTSGSFRMMHGGVSAPSCCAHPASAHPGSPQTDWRCPPPGWGGMGEHRIQGREEAAGFQSDFVPQPVDAPNKEMRTGKGVGWGRLP